MKPKIRTPFFEIGIKNYIYGDAVLELAMVADRAAEQYDIDVLFITPYTEIRRVAEHTSRLIVIAPYMDLIPPGRGMAAVLPEAVRAAGARGVVVNHCERPMSLADVEQTIQRADELGLLSFACASSIKETRAIACLGPDIINPEPSELIGSGKPSDMGFVMESIRAVKEIDSNILVEQAAGVSTPEQVYRFICAGAEATGAASGIFGAPDPHKMAVEMIASVRRAQDDLHKQTKSKGAI